jgi:hypothetical protein
MRIYPASEFPLHRHGTPTLPSHQRSIRHNEYYVKPPI